jgi:SAM-dependent methyltransferase
VTYRPAPVPSGAASVPATEARLEPAPAGEPGIPVRPVFDVSRPNIARVYDYWLGGKDNYAADRDEAGRLLQIYPLLGERARENRLFLARAVAWLAKVGIGQFLDVGAGLPTAQNTHQIAQQVNPACRVVYADNDRVVVRHAQALLAGTGVAAIEADLADPAAVIADPQVRELIDPGEPTGLILAMVLHFFGAPAATAIVQGFVRWLAPGSYLVVSVGCGDEHTGGQLARAYTAATLHNHSPAQIRAFFAGLGMVPPGLVDARNWFPGQPPIPPAPGGGHILAGVARKPATS